MSLDSEKILSKVISFFGLGVTAAAAANIASKPRADLTTERDLCVGTRGCLGAFPFYFEAAIEDTETYSSWGKQLACL